MVDTTKIFETGKVNPYLVKNSTTKRLVITEEGYFKKWGDNNILYLPVNMDEQKLLWVVKKECVIDLQNSTGTKESKEWIGITIQLSISLDDKGEEIVKGKQIKDDTTN